MSERSESGWRPPHEPLGGEVQVVVRPRRSPVRMPAMCVVCGTSPSLDDPEAGPRPSFEILPVVVDAPAVGCFGEYEAHEEFAFPVCEVCVRARGEQVVRAVRVLGVRGHFDGVSVYLAFRNEPFARAFEDAAGRP